MTLPQDCESDQSILIVGTFKTESDAADAKKIIEDLTKLLKAGTKKKSSASDTDMNCYSKEMLDYLDKLNFKLDVDTFNSTVLLHERSIAVLGNKITILTKDANFQLLLNIMLQKGAKIEISKQ